jgi:hypothetical protein
MAVEPCWHKWIIGGQRRENEHFDAAYSGGSALGHEDQFPRPSLSGRCRLGEATFAAMGRKEEDAPRPAVRQEQPAGSGIAVACAIRSFQAPGL